VSGRFRYRILIVRLPQASQGRHSQIDGLFIRDLPNDHDNQVFVKSIVDVARGMNKITVAEFVEDAETLAMLKAFGVDMVQGYHLDMRAPITRPSTCKCLRNPDVPHAA